MVSILHEQSAKSTEGTGKEQGQEGFYFTFAFLSVTMDATWFEGGSITDPFLFSLNSVLPILLMVALGVALRMVKWIDDDFAGRLNELCFKLFIPLQIFVSIYRADFMAAFDSGLMAFGIAATLVVLFAACLIVPRFVKDRNSQGAYIQGLFRGNIALIGTSLMQSLFGSQGVVVMGVLMPVLVFLYSICATWVLARFSGNERPCVKDILKKLVTNPFLIAASLGLVSILIDPPIPGVVDKTLQSLGAVGTPLALISLGATLKLSELRRSGLLALSAAAIRQFAIPVVVIVAAIWLGFRDMRLAAILCVFLTPAASGSYVLAKNMKADHVLAGQILLMSTTLSFLSMMVALAVLRSLQYI